LFTVLRPGLLPSYSRFIQWREQAIEAEEEVVMMVGTVVVEEVMEGEEEMVVVVAGMMVVVLAGMVAVVELAGMMVLVVLAGMTVLVVLAVHVSIGGQTIKVAVCWDIAIYWQYPTTNCGLVEASLMPQLVA
jgi:hypothetical protein